MSAQGGGDPADGAPRASDFVEREAVEEGAEGREEDEEDVDGDDGADLEGFIAEGAEAAADGAAADGAESSESDEADAGDDPELGEEDLAVLEDAGLDTSQVRKRKRELEAEAAAKRQRKEGNSNEAMEKELFGDDDDDLEDLGAAPAEKQPAEPEEDVFAGMSDDDVDDFVVRDSGAAKRRRDVEGSELNISDEQLQEIVDIFGDTSVLRPLDQIGEQDQGPSAPKAEEQVPEPQQEEQVPAVVPIELVDEDVDLDPDLQAKLYATREDKELERRDVPENWFKAYHADPSVLDSQGRREWTDEEHKCETLWIWKQKFSHREDNRRKTDLEGVIMRILDLLHHHKLDPEYIVAQYLWKFGEGWNSTQLRWIFDGDLQWQGLWAMYKRLMSWRSKAADEQGVPDYIEKAFAIDHPDGLQAFFAADYAAEVLKDIHAWFLVNRPTVCGDAARARSSRSAQAKMLELVRESKLDLALDGSSTTGSQDIGRAFGITPEDLGWNVDKGSQMHKPKDDEYNPSPKTVFANFAKQNDIIKSPDGVQQASEFYLSRLIASDIRIRNFVRQEFRKICAVSTYVTDTGKPIAHEAAVTFRKSYRAFHILHKPVSEFKKQIDTDDEKARMEKGSLFLDAVHLENQGFVKMEYSFRIPKENAKTENEYSVALPGNDDDTVIGLRSRINNHWTAKVKQGGFFDPVVDVDAASPGYQVAMEDAWDKWKWCEEILPKLKAIYQSHEVPRQRKANENATNPNAAWLFKVSKISAEDPNVTLGSYLIADPIFVKLLEFYCSMEARGKDELRPLPDSKFNMLRMRILRRVLRDELYPMMWNEVREDLARHAEEIVCAQASEALKQMIDMQPRMLTEEMIKQDQEFTVNNTEVRMEDLEEALMENPRWEFEKEERFAGLNNVLVICPEIQCEMVESLDYRKPNDKKAILALVNSSGDPVDVRLVFGDFHQRPMDERRPGWMENMKKAKNKGWEINTEIKRLEHRAVFMKLLRDHKPAFILLPALDLRVKEMALDIYRIIDHKDMARHFQMKPEVIFGDPSIPRVVAYHPRIMNEGVYRDCEMALQRLAISSARFVQDPLAETAQLWHELPTENGLLKVRLHRLQAAVPQDKLARALMLELKTVLGRCGADVNRMRRSPHLQSVCQLLPGLGPRKATIFRKCISDRITSRDELAQRLAKEMRIPAKDIDNSPVITNCLPFVKIRPDLRDTWDVNITPGIDRTRLGEPYRPWVVALCEKAMKKLREDNPDEEIDSGDEQERDWVALLLRHVEAQARGGAAPRTIVERAIANFDLEEWPDWVGVSEDMRDTELAFASLDMLTDAIVPELTEPFTDKRPAWERMNESTAFYLSIGEVKDNFDRGAVVNCTVTINGDDEHENNKKEGKEESAQPRVRVRVMPSMASGSFPKLHTLSGGETGEQGYISTLKVNGVPTVFNTGDQVRARVTRMNAKNDDPRRGKWSIILSVDDDQQLWGKEFPVQGDDVLYFMPRTSENWTSVKLGHIDTESASNKLKHKDWVQRSRNVRHVNWLVDGDHQRQMMILTEAPIGFASFRPSKRHDMIVAGLKVYDAGGPTDMNVRIFDVYERGRDVERTLELAPELEVDGIVYKDIDEVIARHMDPICDNIRIFKDHDKYAFHGRIEDIDEAQLALADVANENPKALVYILLDHDKMPGHGLLIWQIGKGGVPRQKKEFVEITPHGFTLLNQHFDTVGQMLKWFKEVGYKEARVLRKEFKRVMTERNEARKKKRGEDVLKDKKELVNFSNVATTASGLATPGGAGGLNAPMTSTMYGAESSAPTPAGAAPGTALPVPGSPGPLAMPGSPAPYRGSFTPAGMRGGLGTPGFAPNTPAHMRGGAPAPGTAAPQTPGGAVPGTPGGMAPGTAVPSTPRGLGMPGTPGLPQRRVASAGTPSGMAPGTAVGHVPATPVGLTPGTPAALAPGTPAGLAPGTPAGLAPGSPAPQASGSWGGQGGGWGGDWKRGGRDWKKDESANEGDWSSDWKGSWKDWKGEDR